MEMVKGLQERLRAGAAQPRAEEAQGIHPIHGHYACRKVQSSISCAMQVMEQWHRDQRCSVFSSLEIFKSSGNWSCVLQGLDQVDPEVPSNFSHALSLC